ncbi:hypothetical protein CCICO_07805 [Corynebacterium ciconiae DSM 44920]|uniref:hypothetical protein n=1 Tax=Corynebacterium ciconiae TaxID=227319 RepID=UPI00037FC3A7|nr:hypothetical protein [Corynebacterium ciconiae]WKD61577.1 hypothetical protein CCICO_07805 [Corynebacterium ciconiae DSM 44920]
MPSLTPIDRSPLKHTYPYGADDLEMSLSTTERMSACIERVFREYPRCRRVIVGVDVDDLEGVRACESAGMHFVVDVETRDGAELNLMVAEPDRVKKHSTDIDSLELT